MNYEGNGFENKDTSLEVSLSKSNSGIKLSMSIASEAKDDLLGYEIVKDGKVIGFTTSGTYTDSEATNTNENINYEVIPYAKNLSTGDKVQINSLTPSISIQQETITLNLNEEFNGEEVWKTLITPTKIYVKPILNLIEKFEIKGMSHITGGGFIENVPRMFNGSELTAEIRKDSYPLPAIFEDMINKGVSRDHMYNTFNMGIGLVLAVDPADVDTVMAAVKSAGETPYVIGSIEAGEKGVTLC